ncbi:MAG: lanthionine synthetase C family protein [Thermomicrobiales bacterium]
MREATAWKGIVHGQLRESALEIVFQIAERLRTPERAEEIARQASDQQSGLPFKRRWAPYDASYGNAALALFFGQLDRSCPDQQWDEVAHVYLSSAARSLETVSMNHFASGLFGGLSGTCLVARSLSRKGERYRRLVSTLDSVLIQQTIGVLNQFDANSDGVRFMDYDLIVGPVGIGAYFLSCHGAADADEVLHAILDRLILLSETRNGQLRFFIPPELQATERHREQYPYGATDCGMAHGVPGPLALLALAALHGIKRPGLDDAIRTLVTWLLTHRYADPWGITWPYAIPPDGIPLPYEGSSRAAWCYGSPGVAAALWHAGCALRDQSVKDIAIEAMHAVRIRPIETRGIPSPILCHGVAGLLQITMRFANYTCQESFVGMANELTRELVDLFEPTSLAGFRDLDPEGRKVDNPGLLDGATGVALALLAAATDAEPIWDRMFLLS